MRRIAWRKNLPSGWGTYRVILFSYMAMLLIAAAASLILLFSSEQLLTGEILRAHQANMYQLRQQLDDGLASVESLLYEESLNRMVSALVAGQRGVSSRARRSFYDATEVATRFRDAVNVNEFVEHAYLMLLTDQYAITDKGTYSLDEFASQFCGNEETMAELLRDQSGVSYRAYLRSPSSQAGVTDIIFIYALPIGGGVKTAVLGAYLSRERIHSIGSDNDWLPEKTFALLDEQGRIIQYYSDDQDQLAGVDWSGLPSGEPHMVVIDGSRYFALTADSRLAPLRYLFVVPVGHFMQTRTLLFRAFTIAITALLALGGAAAMYLSRWQTRPLRRLVSKAGSAGIMRSAEANPNAYGYIEQTLQDYQDENDLLNRLNQTQNGVLANQYLRHILEGAIIDSYAIDGILRECGLAMAHESYFVILIVFDRNTKPADSTESALCNELEEKRLFITEHLRASSPENLRCLYVSADPWIYMIVNSSAEAARNVRSWCDCLRAGLAQRFGHPPLISVSGTHATPTELHDAYLESQAVRSYQHVTGIDRTLVYSELPPDKHEEKVALLLEGQKLANLIRAREYGQARCLFAQIADEKLRRGIFPHQVVVCNLYGLVYTLLTAFEESGVTEALDITDRLMHCDNVVNLTSAFNAILDEMEAKYPAYSEPCDGSGLVREAPLDPAAQESRLSSDTLVEGAVLFIQDRYADPMLSVALVAEGQGVSPVALTRAFKRVLNCGALDYIHHYRLNHAKRYLRNTNDNILTIAQAAGYTNSVTFIRAFKKYEGITPSMYRQVSKT